MPTQSSTASFTTPSASTCPATASAEPARNHPTRVDRTKRSVSLITSQRGSTPWATSCRNTGRHQIGMPGRLHRNQHLDPARQLRVLRLPFGEPGGEVAPHLGEIASIVEPAQLHQAVVIDLARHIIECVPEEVHVAALPDRLGQHLANRRLEPLMVVRDDELDPEETAPLEPGDEIAPARTALAVGELDAQHLAPAFTVDADCNQHRLALNHPGLSDSFSTGIKDQ